MSFSGPQSAPAPSFDQSSETSMSAFEGEGGLSYPAPTFSLTASTTGVIQCERGEDDGRWTLEDAARMFRGAVEGSASDQNRAIRYLNQDNLTRENFHDIMLAYNRLYPNEGVGGYHFIIDIHNNLRVEQDGPSQLHAIYAAVTRFTNPDVHVPNPQEGFENGNPAAPLPLPPEATLNRNRRGYYLVGDRVEFANWWVRDNGRERQPGVTQVVLVKAPSGNTIAEWGNTPGDDFTEDEVSFVAEEAGVYDVVIMEDSTTGTERNRRYQVARYYVPVHSLEGFSENNLEGLETTSYLDHSLNLEFQQLGLGNYAVQDQQLGEQYIESSLRNPYRTDFRNNRGRPDPAEATYRTRGFAGEGRLRWYLAMEDREEVLSKYDDLPSTANSEAQRFQLPPGFKLFRLGNIGTDSLRFSFMAAGRYFIYAEEFGEQGQATDRKATYHQVLLTSEQNQAINQFEEMRERIDGAMGEFGAEGNIPLEAVLTTNAGQDSQQLNFYLGKDTEGNLRLVDASPFGNELAYEGEDIDDLLANFERRNSYITGMVTFRIPDNDIGIPPGIHNIETDGQSRNGALAETGGNLALILGGLGLAASFIPGAQVVAPFLLLAGGIAGTLGSAASIADQLDNGIVDDRQVAIDALGVISGIFGVGVGTLTLRTTTQALNATRYGRWLLYTNAALEGASAIVVSADGIDQIGQIIADDNKTYEQKRQEILIIVANLAVTGGLFAMTATELAQLRAGDTSIAPGTGDGPDASGPRPDAEGGGTDGPGNGGRDGEGPGNGGRDGAGPGNSGPDDAGSQLAGLVPDSAQRNRLLTLAPDEAWIVRNLRYVSDATDLEYYLTQAGGRQGASALEDLFQAAGQGNIQAVDAILQNADGNPDIVNRFAVAARNLRQQGAPDPGWGGTARRDRYLAVDWAHIFERHVWETFSFGGRLRRSTGFFPEGTTPAQVRAYLEEALEILGEQGVVLDGSSETVALRSVSMTVQVGTRPLPGGTGNQQLVGQFFPVSGENVIILYKPEMELLRDLLLPGSGN